MREPELDEPIFRPSIPAVHKNEFSLSFARGRGDDFDIILGFPEDRKIMLPIGPYPKIAEFRTMLSELPKVQPPRAWDGEYFFAYPAEEKEELTLWMRAQGNGMTIGFSQSEWNTVQDLFRKAWENSELKALLGEAQPGLRRTVMARPTPADRNPSAARLRSRSIR